MGRRGRGWSSGGKIERRRSTGGGGGGSSHDLTTETPSRVFPVLRQLAFAPFRDYIPRTILSLSLSPVYIRSSTIVPCSSVIHHSTRLGRVFVSSFFPFSPFSFAKNGEGTSCGNIIADRRFRRGCTRIVNNAREVGTAGNRLTFAMKERERERVSSRRGARRGSGGVSEDIQSMISGLPVVA